MQQYFPPQPVYPQTITLQTTEAYNGISNMGVPPPTYPVYNTGTVEYPQQNW